MEWSQRLSPKRVSQSVQYPFERHRPPWQYDHDRIIFSSAFRRLQDKTQVFPLSSSDYIRTRLTHSLEVSTVARTLGSRVGFELRKKKVLGDTHPLEIGMILSSAALGLESASKSTLLAMNKTKMPDAYLSCAEQLLEAAANLGIFTKVNYLIHPGDSHATVQESLNWLKSHRDLISGISSGVTLEYEGTPLSNRLSTFSTKFGTKRREHELSKWGVYQLDPSADLSLEEAEILARSVAQELQTREAFARSKRFGYLSTDIELESILADLPEANHTTPYS